MCVVSMVMDHYREKWTPLVPPTYPYPTNPAAPSFPTVPWTPWPAPPAAVPYAPPPTPAEIDEFRKLLERARAYDKRNREPDCENADKIRQVKELADKLGVAGQIDFL